MTVHHSIRAACLAVLGLAGWGKEVGDAFGGGNPSREDLEANRIGRRCAKGAGETVDTGALLECCRRELGQPGR